MPSIRVGSASIPGSRDRPRDRIALGEHACVVLGGSANQDGGQNEADVAFPIADALVSSPEPPADGEILAVLERMDEAVYAWRRAAPDAWGAGLDLVAAFPRPGLVRIVHVGTAGAYRLWLPSPAAAPTATRLTEDHTWRAERGDRTRAILSSVGAYPIQKIDLAAIPRRDPMRIALVSEGAIAGLSTPLGYLAGVASPSECAQRICAQARQRSGGPHDATAVVIDCDPEPTAPYR